MIHENDPNKVLYENDKDQSNERKLAQYVSRSWGVEIVKQKKNAQFDYILKKSNGSLAFAELRLRSCPMNKYPTVYMSLGKLIAGHNQTKITGIPSLFIVKWTDKVGCVDIDKCSKTFKLSEDWHENRRGHHEREIVVELDIKDFKEIHEKENA